MVSEANCTSSQPTKRTILSTLVSIFVPLGLDSPVLEGPKIFFPEMHIDMVDWDDSLTEAKVSS